MKSFKICIKLYYKMVKFSCKSAFLIKKEHKKQKVEKTAKICKTKFHPMELMKLNVMFQKQAKWA